mmetsp:Transcript_2796/g.5541  ORF Transcript_2796/g.5541 Transcript_2796/m.5541 type:complete len:222 (-) Transcript_2796:743-1408(-)
MPWKRKQYFPLLPFPLLLLLHTMLRETNSSTPSSPGIWTPLWRGMNKPFVLTRKSCFDLCFIPYRKIVKMNGESMEFKKGNIQMEKHAFRPLSNWAWARSQMHRITPKPWQTMPTTTTTTTRRRLRGRGDPRRRTGNLPRRTSIRRRPPGMLRPRTQLPRRRSLRSLGPLQHRKLRIRPRRLLQGYLQQGLGVRVRYKGRRRVRTVWVLLHRHSVEVLWHR